MQTEICHIANVMDFNIGEPSQEWVVGRIFKQNCNYRRRPRYLVEMLDGSILICSDRVAACAAAHNLSSTYFIAPKI